jgi:hypothetical protein
MLRPGAAAGARKSRQGERLGVNRQCERPAPGPTLP